MSAWRIGVRQYDRSCVDELYHHAVVIPDPGSDYLQPSFEIVTPVDPAQLGVKWIAKSGDGRDNITVRADPIGVNRFPPLLGTFDVDGVRVTEGKPESNGRARYYFELPGWWYTLEGPNYDDEHAAFTMSVLRKMIGPRNSS